MPLKNSMLPILSLVLSSQSAQLTMDTMISTCTRASCLRLTNYAFPSPRSVCYFYRNHIVGASWDTLDMTRHLPVGWPRQGVRRQFLPPARRPTLRQEPAPANAPPAPHTRPPQVRRLLSPVARPEPGQVPPRRGHQGRLRPRPARGHHAGVHVLQARKSS